MVKPFSKRPLVPEREFHAVLRDVASSPGTPTFRRGLAALRTLTLTRSPEVMKAKLDRVFRSPSTSVPVGVNETHLKANLLPSVASSTSHPHPFIRDAAFDAHTRLTVGAMSTHPSPFSRDGFALSAAASGRPVVEKKKGRVAYV